MRYFFLNYIIIILTLSSCSNNANLNEKGEVLKIDRKLSLGDTLVINIPDTINDISNITQPFYNFDDSRFCYQDKVVSNKLNIYCYDLNKKFWTSNTLNINGPDKVLSNGGFSMQSERIFYFPTNDSRLIILNNSGKKIKEFIYSEDRMVAYNSQVKVPFTFIDSADNIYFDITEYKRLDKESTFMDSKLIGKLNLESGEFDKIVPYPQEFIGKTWSTNDVGRNHVLVNDKVYFNFTKSKFIYKYSLDGSLIAKARIANSKIKDSQGLESNDPYQNALSQLKNGHYVAIVYDKWNKLFYRIATYLDTDANLSLENPESIGQAFKSKTISLIAFNQNLEIIARNNFLTKDTGISESLFFVNQDGLHIYQNNVNRKEGEMYLRKVNQEIISP